MPSSDQHHSRSPQTLKVRHINAHAIQLEALSLVASGLQKFMQIIMHDTDVSNILLSVPIAYADAMHNNATPKVTLEHNSCLWTLLSIENRGVIKRAHLGIFL